jgi:hypothetical protein
MRSGMVVAVMVIVLVMVNMLLCRREKVARHLFVRTRDGSRLGEFKCLLGHSASIVTNGEARQFVQLPHYRKTSILCNTLVQRCDIPR